MFPRLGMVLVILSGLLTAGAATAQANVPAPSSVLTTIRIPAAANLAIGAVTFSVAYSDTTATLTAVAPAVSLGANATLKVSTCIMTHTVPALPSSVCSDRIVDTRGNVGMVAYSAPSLTRTLPRPKVGGSAFASAQVVVSIKQSNGSWGASAAGSWPATGLAGAGIAIPVVGALTAKLPPQQGVTYGGQGGVNTGYPDSMCVEEQVPAAAAPRLDVSRTALGNYPAPYEVGEPTDGGPAKGIMIILHGGGWYRVGPGGLDSEQDTADRWRSRGWRTVNASYRGCALSMVDSLALYDRVRAAYGAAVPVCISGSSAGAHLAMEVAAQRSTVSCVIGRGTPTDIAALAGQTAPAINSGTLSPSGPLWLENTVVAAFGQENLTNASPAKLGVHTRVLLATAERDSLVPQAQATTMRDRMLADDPSAYVDVDVLAAGTVPWVHGNVSAEAKDDYEARELALVAPLG